MRRLSDHTAMSNLTGRLVRSLAVLSMIGVAIAVGGFAHRAQALLSDDLTSGTEPPKGFKHHAAVSAITFPVLVPNFSGKVLLIVNEENRNLIAMPILDDGNADPGHGIALANASCAAALSSPPVSGPLVKNTFTGDPDAVAVTADGRFAYVHQEKDNGSTTTDTVFVRFDLQNVEFHGTSHIKSFDMTGHSWLHDPMTVLGSFLYASAMDTECDPCTSTCPVSLFKMAIDPTTGDLGSPTLVAAIDDGGGNVATGVQSRMATDGTCIYVTDNGSTDFCFGIPFPGSTTSAGSRLVYQICDGATTTVKVWADPKTGGDAPGFSPTEGGAGHTIAFGPSNQNLFLTQDNDVYSTTGPSGSTPGSFSKVGTLEGELHNNQGSAFTVLAFGAFLYVGDEEGEEAYAARITGSGASVVATDTKFSISGEQGKECALAGDHGEFDEAQGLAVLSRSPRSNTGAAFFIAPPRPVPTLSSRGLIGAALLLLGAGAFLLARARWAK